jgi:hypothetical protein
MSDKAILRLDWCSYEAAKYAVEHWHYSKTIPWNRCVKIGVWENGKFIGAVIYTNGSSSALYKPYGIGKMETCELVRVALDKHKSSVSKIITIANKLLKKFCPELRLIVSFADPAQGHVGIIYQAAGWIYAGMSSPSAQYIAPDGKLHHGRSISKTGLQKRQGYGRVYRRAWKPEDCQKVTLPGKYRYLYPLDDAMRAQVLPLAKPYPKRDGGEIDSAPGSNRETEGASPIPSLLKVTE